jgi:hypothetical protein
MTWQHQIILQANSVFRNSAQNLAWINWTLGGKQRGKNTFKESLHFCQWDNTMTRAREVCNRTNRDVRWIAAVTGIRFRDQVCRRMGHTSLCMYWRLCLIFQVISAVAGPALTYSFIQWIVKYEIITLYILITRTNSWGNVVFRDVTPCGSCKNRVSEELSASFIRVTRIGELGTTLAVTSNRLRAYMDLTGVCVTYVSHVAKNA